MPMFDGATSPALLQLQGVTVRAGERKLLDIPAIKLGSAGITVLMGPNGAGKSILLRVLHGLQEPDEGQVFWKGDPLTTIATERQALVFQNPVLLRRSAEANVRFVLRARKRATLRSDQLLDLVDLADKAKTPARRLSGGERQRLAIAQALAGNPDLLLLDEPTASLDPTSTAKIEQITLDTAKRGVGVIFVTHDTAQARRLASEVIYMAGGRVVEQKPARDFFENPDTQSARDYLAGRLLTEKDQNA